MRLNNAYQLAAFYGAILAAQLQPVRDGSLGVPPVWRIPLTEEESSARYIFTKERRERNKARRKARKG